MRPDMQKVIVERPRWGHGAPSKKTALRIRPIEVHEDYDSGPARAPSRREDKWFNEHLNPLWRFLRSNLGRPWDKVYAEIREHVSSRGVLGNHVLDHLLWEVERDCVLVDRKVVRARSGLEPFGFWVHPKSGLLHETPRKRRHWRLRKEPLQSLQTTAGELFQRIGGIWYRIVLEPTWPEYWKVDVAELIGPEFMEHLPAQVRGMFRAGGQIAGRVRKQQCGRKELRWIAEQILLAEKGKGKGVRRGPALLVPAGPDCLDSSAIAA